MTSITTTEQIERIVQGVDIMKMRYELFVQTVVTRIVNEEIIQPLKEAMRSHGYSQKIIDGTDLEAIVLSGKKLRVRIKSEYFAQQPDGSFFDVAVAREEGTKDHWIEPIGKDAPAYTKSEEAQGRTVPKALHWETPSGEHAFSKGHVVKGIEARHLVERTIAWGKPKVQTRIRQEFEKWKVDILKT